MVQNGQTPNIKAYMWLALAPFSYSPRSKKHHPKPKHRIQLKLNWNSSSVVCVLSPIVRRRCFNSNIFCVNKLLLSITAFLPTVLLIFKVILLWRKQNRFFYVKFSSFYFGPSESKEGNRERFICQERFETNRRIVIQIEPAKKEDIKDNHPLTS